MILHSTTIPAKHGFRVRDKIWSNAACLRPYYLLVARSGAADDNRSLGDRTRQYLTDLVRLDTSNPPGNETRVADYLKQVADSLRHSAPSCWAAIPSG